MHLEGLYGRFQSYSIKKGLKNFAGKGMIIGELLFTQKVGASKSVLLGHGTNDGI